MEASQCARFQMILPTSVLNFVTYFCACDMYVVCRIDRGQSEWCESVGENQ